MSPSLRFRLSTMMFLNYFVWGCWYVTLGTYLTATLHFTGTQAGAVFGTTALAAMISPFFVGLIADRYFATARVLSALHIVGALFLVLVTRFHTFVPVYAVMLAYCICYFPTIALTNSITLRQIANAGNDFPRIRIFATIGWIAVGLLIGNLGVEKTTAPFLIAAASSIVMALFCFTLPRVAPTPQKSVTIRGALGLDALVMLRQPAYLVFVIASLLACIPLTFYYSFTNAYLNEAGVINAAGKMTLGQVSEAGMLLLMPFIFRRTTVKRILLVGLLAWTVRYLLLAYGNPSDRMWMFYVAILLHGVCYDFFFVTGQLYTDQQAPPHVRSAAQGFITFITYGVGMFVGSLLSGGALDLFHKDWMRFWISSSLASLVLVILVAVLFRSRARIEQVGT